ncbi:MAG: LLM class F420-dependent oxidoreductase [Actinomycetota bacterium]|nr:LLM class F420-dependent oxidoreductase [Actinomycetota bacterium]
MRFGAVFPTTEIGNDPIAIRDFAQAAEGLGYSRLTTYDHVLGAEHANRTPPLTGPYTEHDAFHEPMVLFGYLAGLTSTIEFATGVLILPQRQAVLVAKQAAEVDLLSGGRLVLGVGTGWNHVEYNALGTSFGSRGRRMEEQVAVLRSLWGDELVDFDGEFHRIDRAALVPRPARPIPVWFGGSKQASLRRAARTGDGFIFGRSGPAVVEALGTLHTMLAEQDRDPAAFGSEALIDYALGPDAWHEQAAAWEHAGGSIMSIRAMSSGAAYMKVPVPNFAKPAQHLEALELFMREMGGQ